MNMSASHDAPKSACGTARGGRPLRRLAVRLRSGESAGFDFDVEQKAHGSIMDGGDFLPVPGSSPR
jgi:hypothetical protein